MERLLAQGCTIQQVAEQFGTSRQIVAKYLNPKLPKGCTMRMTYMCGHRPCTLIDVDFLSEKVYVYNRTDDLLHRAFGVVEDPTWEDFQDFEKPLLPGHPGECQGGTAGAGSHRLRSASNRGEDPRTHRGR